jgi:hypothetical protein
MRNILDKNNANYRLIYGSPTMYAEAYFESADVAICEYDHQKSEGRGVVDLYIRANDGNQYILLKQSQRKLLRYDAQGTH